MTGFSVGIRICYFDLCREAMFVRFQRNLSGESSQLELDNFLLHRVAP